MRQHHDMGGLPAGPVERQEHDYALWEKRVDALMVLLAERGLLQRWISAIAHTLLQRGVLTAVRELLIELARLVTRDSMIGVTRVAGA